MIDASRGDSTSCARCLSRCRVVGRGEGRRCFVAAKLSLWVGRPAGAPPKRFRAGARLRQNDALGAATRRMDGRFAVGGVVVGPSRTIRSPSHCSPREDGGEDLRAVSHEKASDETSQDLAKDMPRVFLPCV